MKVYKDKNKTAAVKLEKKFEDFRALHGVMRNILHRYQQAPLSHKGMEKTF